MKFNRLKQRFTTLIGQPLPETHPHLLQPNEISPFLLLSTFRQRRSKLASKMRKNSMAIIGGYGLRYATGSIFYPFHQNNDLLYFTGFNEKDSAFILEKDHEGIEKFTLFLNEKNKFDEVWDGPVCGTELSKKYFNANNSYPIQQFKSILKNLILEKLKKQDSLRIYTDLPIDVTSIEKSFELLNLPVNIGDVSHSASLKKFDSSISKFLKNCFTPNESKAEKFHDEGVLEFSKLDKIIQEERLYKSKEEIEILKKCGKISGKAFIETMKSTKPYITEHFLQALIEFNFKKFGGEKLSYVPVVAGGERALIIHYVINNQIVKDGDLILMDAGCEYGMRILPLYFPKDFLIFNIIKIGGYVSDITRTWPVNGKFTVGQKALYEAVLKANKESIKEINQLYPHHISHYLGMDVHDTPLISRMLKLKENMVVTIEPGLYIPNSTNYSEEFRGIGIRIEDDVVVTKDGEPLVLSKNCPKEVHELESIIGTS
ncbi:Xaa-Pro aminopeptidase 3 [Clydaea vesicula]|uniref:Xaa-Pro aminopeptidase 3 n=1 Tax=Clydaea vesicula TaxID=447962 RepID=A0AAD5XWR0_9FUNG|nr:Xaa-Pro aminopeptidase 3 [Clydaea vesicula]